MCYQKSVYEYNLHTDTQDQVFEMQYVY